MKTACSRSAGIPVLFLGLLAFASVQAQTGVLPPAAPPASIAFAQGLAGAPSHLQAALQETTSPDVTSDQDRELQSQSSPPVETLRVPALPVPAPPASALLDPGAPAPSAGHNLQTSLLIEVETVRPDVAVSVAIYGDAESFLSGEGPVRTLSLAQNSPVARAFVLNLPPGRYAIVAWQDMNGDGLPGRAPFEAASDPTGFSRAGEVRTETPAFDAAAFDLGSSGVTQRITLQAH